MFTTDVYPDQKVAVHTIEGELTMLGIFAAMHGLYQRADFKPEFGVVWDLRDNDLAITMQEIIYLDAKFVEAANANRPGGRVAWVPATRFGGAILETLYAEHPWTQEWRNFTSLEEALSWAGGG